MLGRGMQKQVASYNARSTTNSGEYHAGYAAGQASAKQSFATQAASSGTNQMGTTTAKDDLKKIEGIGPKIHELLNADGIHSFDQLTGVPLERLQTILEKAGPRFRLAKPGSWAEQARLCAQGTWQALQKLQEELTAGVGKSSPPLDSNL